MSRPSSAKLSRPSSGKRSRPSSGKISRPQSGHLSRPASGKVSRPSSAGGTPELTEQVPETSVDQQTNLDGDLTASQTAAGTVETLVHEEVDNQSKELESKLNEENLNKTDSELTKTVSEKGSKDRKALGRQKGLKVKKPVQQRQRPGKGTGPQKTETPSVHGGYISQEDNVTESDIKTDIKDSLPDIIIEPDTEALPEMGESEGSNDNIALAVETDAGISNLYF